MTASSRDPELRRRANSVAEQDRAARGFRPGPSHVAVGIATIVTVVALLVLVVVPKLTGSGDPSSSYDTDVYVVRTGDTISSVAALHAITDDALEQANNLTSTSSLDPDTELTIPLPPASGSYPAGLEGNDDLLALRSTFEQWADEYDVPVVLLEADLWQESAWNNDAVSSDGAVGIGQLLPSTTSYINETLLDGDDLDPTDPSDNIQLSAAYFQYLLEGSDGSWAEALASYFAGPTSAENSAWDTATVAYVTKGMGYLADFQD